MTDKEDLDVFLNAWRSNAENNAPRFLLEAQLLRACEEIEKLMTTLYDYEALQKENDTLKRKNKAMLNTLDVLLHNLRKFIGVDDLPEFDEILDRFERKFKDG